MPHFHHFGHIGGEQRVGGNDMPFIDHQLQFAILILAAFGQVIYGIDE